MYVLHLSGDTVKILEGACTRRKLVINSLYSVAMPCDYLDAPDDKGYEKIEAVVTNGLRDLGEEFKNKKIRVVLRRPSPSSRTRSSATRSLRTATRWTISSWRKRWTGRSRPASW